ncbi:integrase [Verrucosispora sp. ts21]|uniref:Mu transposase C-terminal domain-containing protein n=1 Tax=Verrucosispora sp. ts21 TaxID=2069341 RepID=UPI000C88CCEE|nr:Mu transposase C-terminal domain-containing protein [Verrucosispora sp. ts21]PMR62196.1 integrase [Verrucosispora sp. ts21]
MTRLLRVGDRVAFDGAEHQVAVLSGSWVRLVSPDGTPRAVLLTHLVGSPGFDILGADPAEPRTVLADHALADVAEDVAQRARQWEQHIIEVETGLPPGVEPGTAPRSEYDPRLHGMRQRVAAKAEELSASGIPASVATVQRMRQRYRTGGLRALVDGRSQRPVSQVGRADERVVAAIREALIAQENQSTGTRSRLRHQVERILTQRHGAGVVALPPKSTFHRLVAALSVGQHTFGAATTRRSTANRPGGPFTVTWAARPGQQVQIDTTVLDVMVVFDDGQARRVELTAAVDVATRTICAAVLRPVGTKAVDASLLLARMLVPEPMRPGWDESLRMAASRLPHRRLAAIDARMEQAAAKPVVVPETIVCDRGKVYLSDTFLRACQTLGISVQPAHPRSPTDKGIVERTFGSINTLFCQYVAGYTGRDVAHRGSRVQAEAVWSMAQMQDLLDEWIIIGWQQRPHDGLLSPDTGRVLSPNEMFAVLVTAAGYVPLMLTGDDYVELLPGSWRTINDYGIRLDGRTYDSRALNPYRRQHSGIAAKQGLWEVRHDPYDLTHVWVRNHRGGGWIRAGWTHLPMVAAPFADFTWRHARQQATSEPAGEPDETATARVLADLLRRAGEGPTPQAPVGETDRRVAARTRAAATSHRPRVAPEPPPEDDVDEPEDGQVDNVIPFGIFDAREEAQRWL